MDAFRWEVPSQIRHSQGRHWAGVALRAPPEVQAPWACASQRVTAVRATGPPPPRLHCYGEEGPAPPGLQQGKGHAQQAKINTL